MQFATSFLPEEKLLLLLLNFHGSFTPPGVGNVDPRGLTPGPGLSLQGGLQGAEGSSPRVCAVFQGRLCCQPHRAFVLPCPLSGSLPEQCESLGSQCRASSLGTETMAAVFLCSQAPMQLTQKPPLCPLGAGETKKLFFQLRPHILQAEKMRFPPQSSCPFSWPQGLQGSLFSLTTADAPWESL